MTYSLIVFGLALIVRQFATLGSSTQAEVLTPLSLLGDLDVRALARRSSLLPTVYAFLVTHLML